MVITDVEALMLRQPSELNAKAADGSQDALVIRVHTDEGIVGLGEVDSIPAVAKAVVEAPASHKLANGLRSLLVGENPLDIGRLWQKMYVGTLYFGRRGAAIHAIAGVDIALWDIAGKAAGRPIHALLGGARRDRIRAYASTLMPFTVEETRSVVRSHLDAGFRAIKLGYGPLGQDAELDVALVRAAREEGGDAFDLMVDIGKGWVSIRDAIDRSRRMAEYRPYWIEEPFLPDDYEKYRALVEAVDTPITAGEEESVLSDFERLVDRGGVEVVQPDVTRAGGISEVSRIADMVRRRGRRCVCHAWSTGIIKAATLQLLASIEEADYFEYCVQETELNRHLVPERFPIQDGMVSVPQGPGLGIEIDEEVLERCTVR